MPPKGTQLRSADKNFFFLHAVVASSYHVKPRLAALLAVAPHIMNALALPLNRRGSRTLNGSSLILVAFLLFLVPKIRAAILLDPVPEASTTLFGYSIVGVGDVDGDGIPDLAVGEPFADGDFAGPPGFGPPQNVGRVCLISGANLKEIRPLNDPAYQVVTTEKFAGQLGTSVGAAGDLNGDGVPDVLAGVPHRKVVNRSTDVEIISAGRAYVFSGKDGTVLLTLDPPGPEENARAGYAVASLGDINSDGKPDFVIGAPGKNIGSGEGGVADVGVAYFFSGADGSLIRSVSDPDETVNARFGSALANAGDINGDGVSDVLIGAPGKGQVFLFSGKTGFLLSTIRCPVTEDVHSFGYAVAGGKDVDGDGKPDFLVGAPLLKNYRGGVFVFRGSNRKLLRQLRIKSAQTFSKAGASVAMIDDMTGDGKADVMVGIPEKDVGGLVKAGEVLIFDGASGALFQTVTSETPQGLAGFGSAVTAVDFDGDGKPSPVIGVPYQNADIDPGDGDLVTHLQIGQIEVH